MPTKQMDVIVLNPRTKLPLGRPWLTLQIDGFSRQIVGFYIALHATSKKRARKGVSA